MINISNNYSSCVLNLNIHSNLFLKLLHAKLSCYLVASLFSSLSKTKLGMSYSACQNKINLWKKFVIFCITYC